MTPALKHACERAVHVIKTDGTILRAGRASMFILEHCGWGWIAKLLAVPPFIWIVEVCYWIVARNRNVFARILFTEQ